MTCDTVRLGLGPLCVTLQPDGALVWHCDRGWTLLILADTQARGSQGLPKINESINRKMMEPTRDCDAQCVGKAPGKNLSGRAESLNVDEDVRVQTHTSENMYAYTCSKNMVI